MLTYRDALQRVRDSVAMSPARRVPLDEALGLGESRPRVLIGAQRDDRIDA